MTAEYNHFSSWGWSRSLADITLFSWSHSGKPASCPAKSGLTYFEHIILFFFFFLLVKRFLLERRGKTRYTWVGIPPPVPCSLSYLFGDSPSCVMFIVIHFWGFSLLCHVHCYTRLGIPPPVPCSLSYSFGDSPSLVKQRNKCKANTLVNSIVTTANIQFNLRVCDRLQEKIIVPSSRSLMELVCVEQWRSFLSSSGLWRYRQALEILKTWFYTTTQLKTRGTHFWFCWFCSQYFASYNWFWKPRWQAINSPRVIWNMFMTSTYADSATLCCVSHYKRRVLIFIAETVWYTWKGKYTV